jgi:hypothetical protein
MPRITQKLKHSLFGVFRRSDFHEAPDGAVKVLMPLSHKVSAATLSFGQVAAPHVEKVRNLLARGVETQITRTNPLTGAARRRAAAKVTARKMAQTLASERASIPRRRKAGVSPSPLAGCVDCGAPVSEYHRVRCDSCIETDPRQSHELRGRRAAAISSRRRAEAEWEQANPGVQWDPDYFSKKIFPGLQGVKLSAIVEACGVSKGTAWDWRAGRWRPHPSHWMIWGLVSTAMTASRFCAGVN